MAVQAPEVPPPAAGSRPDAIEQTWALVRPWIDHVPRQQRRLGVFISLALLAHLTAFFFIRIDTTRAEIHSPLRTHLSIAPAVAEGKTSASGFWDRLTDPRLFILPPTPAPDASSALPVDFAAIDDNLADIAGPAPAPAGEYQFARAVAPPLDQRAQDALQPLRQTFTYTETPAPIASGTVWQWQGALAGRNPPDVPALPSPVSETNLVPTVFRVAVDASGTVRDVLLEQSCGKAELDQQASLALLKIRFRGVDHPGNTWGEVSVAWRYSTPPREDVVPTPPTSG